MLDTLRAFNHEFLNKLHIILGYLQTGEIQQAMNFITNSSLVSSQSVRETANCIRVPKICALVIGKMMHAAELGIRLLVSTDSTCRDHDLLIPVDGFATILGNLMENAIRHSGSTAPIGVKVSRKKSGAVFTISDNGKGIDPSRIPDIFDGKTQHGSSDSSRGIGIGLSICKSIILAHDGKIFAKNNLNGGASFTFVLPMKGESDYAQ